MTLRLRAGHQYREIYCDTGGRVMKEKTTTTHQPLPEPPVPINTPTIAEIAAQQGVKPIEDIDELLGDFWPEDESEDEFLATIRAWRDGLNP